MDAGVIETGQTLRFNSRECRIFFMAKIHLPKPDLPGIQAGGESSTVVI
jgi:hypothetical protein